MAAKRLPDGRIPILLSAHADDLVRADARAIADYCDRSPHTTVAQVAQQLHATRRNRRHRAVLRAADRTELGGALRALAAGREHPLVAESSLSVAHGRAFVFPGQGRHWPGMGTAAYRAIPCYRAAANRLAKAFEDVGAHSPLRYLTAPAEADGAGAFAETEVQAAQFVHAVALAEVWRACGVVPDLTVGQSLGEVAAAFVAGSITLSDAAAVVAARAAVVEHLPGCYAMAMLGVGADEAEALIAATDGWAEVAVVYSASSVAVSGDRDAVLTIVDAVRSRGRFARQITAGFPGHTSLLEPLRDELRNRLPESEFADAPARFVGGTTGDAVPAGTALRDYWYANLRSTARLDRAFATALRAGAGSFVELSAHPALLFPIAELAGAELPVLVGSTRRDQPVLETLSANIVTAAVADPGYAWGDYLHTRGGGLPGFPNAPMRATPMWAHPEPLAPAPPALTTAVEHWVAAQPRAPVAGPPVRLALVALGGDGTLLRPLRAAVEAHPAATLSAPQDAEIVAVLAPAALGAADAVASAEALTRLVGTGLLDYVNTPGPRCHTVCLVTVCAERVRADESPSPGHAALGAMHRSIGFQFPERTFSRLDLPSWDVTASRGAAVVQAVLSGGKEAALRDSADLLFERAFRDASAAAHRPFDPAMLDDVVITGGSGALGVHYARYLAAHGARRIVLLSRRPADPAVLASLAGEHRTRFLATPCDIADRAQLAAVAAEHGGAGASLIVHAAGAAAFGPADGLTAQIVADTFAAKVTGLAHLAELWPARADARILVCSSVSGEWGGRGHAAYSAANRLADVMAAQLRARGRRSVSVRWGLWQAPTGARSIADTAGIADVERSGLCPMDPQRAIEASLRDWTDDPLIFAADAARLRIFLGGNSSGELPDVITREPAGSPVAVVDAVRTHLAAVLGIAQGGQVDLATSFFDLGVDSMLALDLRGRLKRTLGRTVSLATLTGDITGAELVAELELGRSDEARKVGAESGHRA